MAKVRRTSRRGKPVRSKPILQPPSRTLEVASGVVGLLTRTAVTALSGVRDVGAEVGEAAVTAVRGSVRAAGEIGADVGRLVSGTIEGVREIMQTPAAQRPAAVKPLQKVRRAAGGRAEGETLAQRKPLARRPSRTQRMGARPDRAQTGSTS